MATFGVWLKQAPPLRTALGLLLLLVTASFSLGAASVNLVGIPARIADLEVALLNTDALVGEALKGFQRHIQQDSLTIACIYQVVYLMAEGEGPVNPLTCGRPGGTE